MNSRRNWLGVIFGALLYMAQRSVRKLERKYLESFEMQCWRRMEKIKRSEKVTNVEVLERKREKRILLNNNILHRKANWVGPILRRNCILPLKEI